MIEDPHKKGLTKYFSEAQVEIAKDVTWKKTHPQAQNSLTMTAGQQSVSERLHNANWTNNPLPPIQTPSNYSEQKGRKTTKEAKKKSWQNYVNM